MYPSYGLPTFPMLVPGFLGALAWLGASRRKVGSRPTLHSGVILHRGLLSAVLCAALGKPGRLLRNPLRTHIELLAALLVFAGEPG